MGAIEESGKVATSTVEAMRSQPGLLFLTIVNIAFLVFTYFTGQLVKQAYDEQQRQTNERYQMALKTVDRCIEVAFSSMPATAAAATAAATAQTPPPQQSPPQPKGATK
jgi:hypothetical protein